MCKHIITFPAVFFAVLIVFAKNKKHETGFEPAALALARRCSTTEPLVRIQFVRIELVNYIKHKILCQ